MAQYRITVNATSHTTINTEDTYIEILPPANVSVILKRVRVSVPHTTATDQPLRVRILRTSAAGATGTSFTPVKCRPAAPASVSTCLVKNGTTAFTVGTVVDVVADTAINTRGVYEWVARDENDMIVSGINQRLIIAARVNQVSTVLNAECDFEE